MAFYSDDFNSNPGPLAARQNWQRVLGATAKDLAVVAAGYVSRPEVGSGTDVDYYLYAVAAASQSVAVKWTATSGTVQLIGMGSASGGNRSCYRFLKASGKIRLTADDADGTSRDLWVVSALRACDRSVPPRPLRLGFEVLSDRTNISLYVDGSSTPLQTFPDMHANRKTSGRSGLLSSSHAQLASELFDDFVTDIVMDRSSSPSPYSRSTRARSTPGRSRST